MERPPSGHMAGEAVAVPIVLRHCYRVALTRLRHGVVRRTVQKRSPRAGEAAAWRPSPSEGEVPGAEAVGLVWPALWDAVTRWPDRFRHRWTSQSSCWSALPRDSGPFGWRPSYPSWRDAPDRGAVPEVEQCGS